MMVVQLLFISWNVINSKAVLGLSFNSAWAIEVKGFTNC